VTYVESELNDDSSQQRDLIDTKLREYAECGVAFHHAGLDIKDRRAVEDMFIHGGLKLIVSTSVSRVMRS
jgi:ATP-dependent DNA helicase HFM1/MER3